MSLKHSADSFSFICFQNSLSSQRVYTHAQVTKINSHMKLKNKNPKQENPELGVGC